MKTLEQIKNNYAKEKGFNDWDKLIDFCVSSCYTIELNEHVDQICALAQKEALMNASESVEIGCAIEEKSESKNFVCKSCMGGGCELPIVLKHSILNENNIIK